MAVDFTNAYNTPLSATEEKAFQAWVAKSGHAADLYNYDMRGVFKKGVKQTDNGHYPDTYKKPNHPTFSDESIYSGPQIQGGKWLQTVPPSKENPEGQWQFAASPHNLKYQTPDELKTYFKQVEPTNQLLLPTPPAVEEMNNASPQSLIQSWMQ